MQRLKCVVVGDRSVGKTSLISRFVDKSYSRTSDEPNSDIFMTNLVYDGQEITLAFFNTHGQECYEQLRSLAYPNSDVFLLCFSLSSEHSYQSTADYWSPEIRQYCPEIPVILVGTKSDMRCDEQINESLIQKKDGHKLKDKIKAIDYLECSAKTSHGVDKVLNATVKAALSYNHCKSSSRKSCNIS